MANYIFVTAAMIILSCNVRDVGREAFIDEIAKLSRLYHLDNLLPIETKVNSNRTEIILKYLTTFSPLILKFLQ